jgi:chloramphenicol O-acetyltransferase type A
MLLDYCIGKAAASIKEFYILPVDNKLMQYDNIAVNTIVKNKNGEVNSCDIKYTDDLNAFNTEYLEYTAQVADSCADRDLSDNCMVIGTSALAKYEIDGAVGVYSGIFNNTFMILGKYKCHLFKTTLTVSSNFIIHRWTERMRRCF